MEKINLNDIVSGFNLSKINENFQKIATALNDNVLWRKNVEGEPNQMQNDLDMNGQRIYNLPEPVAEHEPARKKDIDDINVTIGGKKTLRVEDIDIPAFPNAAARRNKLVSFDNSGNPQVQFPSADSATQLRIDLADSGQGDRLVQHDSRTVHQKLTELVTLEDYSIVGDGIVDDTSAFTALESEYKGRVFDLRGKNYKTTKDFSGNTYINGSFSFSKIAVDGDVSIYNPTNKGFLTNKNISTTGETKSGLKLATIDGAINGAVLDTYSNILYTLENVSGTVAGLDEVNRIRAYKWSGQNKTLVSTITTPGSANIGHQSLGIQVLQSGTRSTPGDVRLWTLGGTSLGSSRNEYATRFKVNSDGSLTDFENFKLWGSDVVTADSRVLGTDPSNQILFMTGIRGTEWFMRVFDLKTLTVAGDYSNQYICEFRTQTYNRSLQDATSDGKFIYLYHGGTAFSSTLKYLETYTLEGVYVGTTKIQAGSLRAWEIFEDGGDLLYEPEAIFTAPGLYGHELLFANTNGTPVGSTNRETTIYTLRPAQSLQLKSSSSTIPALVLDAVHDIAINSGDQLTISEVAPNGDLNTLQTISRTSSSITNPSGDHTASVVSSGNAAVGVENGVRRGQWQVSASGNMGIWDSTNSDWVLYSSAARNLFVNAPILFTTNGTRNIGSPTQGANIIYSQNLVLKPPTSVTPANNGEVTFQLTSNTALAVKVKGSDGVVRTGTITLA